MERAVKMFRPSFLYFSGRSGCRSCNDGRFAQRHQAGVGSDQHAPVSHSSGDLNAKMVADMSAPGNADPFQNAVSNMRIDVTARC